MSTGGGKGAHAQISENNIIAFGIAGGLIGIYAAYFLVDLIGGYMSFLAGLGAICGILWGASAVRRVSSYGLGTGVPSIGMLALGIGLVATLFGLAVGGIAGPIISVISAAIIGYIVGILANRTLGIGVPIMEQSMTEIATSGAIIIIGLSTAMIGTFNFEEVVIEVIATGYMAVIFIAGGLAVLHPYNANLGPDEKQDRTFATAIEKGAIAMILAGVVASINESASGTLTILIGLLIWYIAFTEFYKLVKRDAYKITGSGLLPSKEELE
ncbi:MAG: tetrahydromethanopterin S-methyltransferase subunit C [Methanosarcinaceae archaeon]|nr:tetrahydromethanopterin S-methyltransferase subunit C [Methanosarcinaceae archaeon]